MRAIITLFIVTAIGFLSACKKDSGIPTARVKVIEYASNQPVNNATVKLYYGGNSLDSSLTTTDSNGYFSYEVHDFVFATLSKNGYIEPMYIPNRLAYTDVSGLHMDDSLLYMYPLQEVLLHLVFDSTSNPSASSASFGSDLSVYSRLVHTDNSTILAYRPTIEAFEVYGTYSYRIPVIDQALDSIVYTDGWVFALKVDTAFYCDHSSQSFTFHVP